jgi:Ca2+-binding EF-hand superfamily protein
MRAVGLYPSEAELFQITKSSRNKIDFNEFLNIASKNVTDNKLTEQQMRESFKMFDIYGKFYIAYIIIIIIITVYIFLNSGTGLVNLMQMRTSLQSLGEKLRVFI